MAGNIKSGVKIFNVTGSLVDRSSISTLSLSSKTYTVSGQKTVSSPTAGTAVLMGTITLPSTPFCISLPGHWSSDRTNAALYSFDGCAITHGYTSNISHILYDNAYSGSHVGGIVYFPSLDATMSTGSYHGGVEVVTGSVISALTSQSSTPFKWKSGQFSTSSASIQYMLAMWSLHFSSDLKTGYIYCTPYQKVYGAYGEYTAYPQSITSPTSITIGNISF